MSVSGYNLAEVYVKRKLHKEKLKQMEQDQRATNAATTTADGYDHHSRVKQSNGCNNLFGVIKKVHPTNSQMVITDSVENAAG